jgi:hypothetical protein
MTENPKSMDRRNSVAKEHKLSSTVLKHCLKWRESKDQLEFLRMNVPGTVGPGTRFHLNPTETLLFEH